MGTSNFYSKSKIIFASKIENDFDYSNLKSNIIHELKQSKNYSHMQKDDMDRNFYGSSVGTLSLSCPYQFDITIEIKCYIRAGYYENCNLDYEINFAVLHCDYDNEDSLIKDIKYYSLYDNNGLTKIHTKNLVKWLDKAQKELINEVEKIFFDYTTPLNKVCTFSNGETIYSKIA